MKDNKVPVYVGKIVNSREYVEGSLISAIDRFFIIPINAKYSKDGGFEGQEEVEIETVMKRNKEGN